ncbi:PPE family protein [Mycobacterium avium subsp. avium 2285 (R)]|nr:PPE family protein [Mycobacterium avium subsp. avium 2285 (R)]
MIPAFVFFPPEINSALIAGGAGSGPLFEAASAWDGLAAELSSSASSFQTVVTDLAAGPWMGPSSVAMTAAAAPYVQWLIIAAAQAEVAALQARLAALAFEGALVATVPLPAVLANRARLLVLIATNFFGQNTAAIAQTELEYVEMWLRDVAAMLGYHAGAQSAAQALPAFTVPPPAWAAARRPRPGRPGRVGERTAELRVAVLRGPVLAGNGVRHPAAVRVGGAAAGGVVADLVDHLDASGDVDIGGAGRDVSGHRADDAHGDAGPKHRPGGGAGGDTRAGAGEHRQDARRDPACRRQPIGRPAAAGRWRAGRPWGWPRRAWAPRGSSGRWQSRRPGRGRCRRTSPPPRCRARPARRR